MRETVYLYFNGYAAIDKVGVVGQLSHQLFESRWLWLRLHSCVPFGHFGEDFDALTIA
jgi:hypothetical protein